MTDNTSGLPSGAPEGDPLNHIDAFASDPFPGAGADRLKAASAVHFLNGAVRIDHDEPVARPSGCVCLVELA